MSEPVYAVDVLRAGPLLPVAGGEGMVALELRARSFISVVSGEWLTLVISAEDAPELARILGLSVKLLKEHRQKPAEPATLPVARERKPASRRKKRPRPETTEKVA
jgi:hypothetical protein